MGPWGRNRVGMACREGPHSQERAQRSRRGTPGLALCKCLQASVILRLKVWACGGGVCWRCKWGRNRVQCAYRPNVSRSSVGTGLLTFLTPLALSPPPPPPFNRPSTHRNLCCIKSGGWSCFHCFSPDKTPLPGSSRFTAKVTDEAHKLYTRAESLFNAVETLEREGNVGQLHADLKES